MKLYRESLNIYFLVYLMTNSRPKPGRMEETLEGARGLPRALEPLERERETERERVGLMTACNEATTCTKITVFLQ